jgi:sulfhydrogenase subunit alpha
LLHAPDFFGVASGIELARQFPQEVNRGLQLKKFGNRLLEVLGGRAIHPINVAVGGFHRIPRRENLAALIPDFEWGLQAAIETTRWVAGFEFPEFEQPYEFVALSHPDEYAMNEGEIVASDGLRIPVEQFDDEFVEVQVPHSTALHAVRKSTGQSYLVGPLARIHLNREQLSPSARQLAEELDFPSPCQNPYRSIIARALELVHAYETALALLKGDHDGPARIAYTPRDGSGVAATEAPRGLLYHRYETTSAGTLTEAKIVPPTSQNQGQIERDVRDWLVPRLAQGANRDELAQGCEQLVRTYDPCISCSTHFLRVRWEEKG